MTTSVSDLHPGAEAPLQPVPVAELADRLRVSEASVQGWIDDGLLQLADGNIDPLDAVNWLADSRLDRCPVLARRWRRFFTWWSPFVAGQDRPRRLALRRIQRIHLPRPGRLTWWLPALPEATAEHWDQPLVRQGAHWHWQGHADSGLHLSGHAELILRPLAAAEVSDLLPVVEEVITGWTYRYRRHHRNEVVGRTGDCLDLALALGRRLDRPWRLVSGCIASNALINPHCWIEVDTCTGWRPVDPTLPLLARRAGRSDWREWLHAWCGGCDARRIVLGRSDTPVAEVPEPTLGSAAGEAVLDGDNAWNCQDWPAGACHWSLG